MQKSHVAITRCTSYDEKETVTAISTLITQLGGLGKYIQPGQHILVKPNLLMAVPPEKACTTHPSVMIALIRHLLDFGVRVSFGDLPGGFYAGTTARVHKATQMTEVAEATGATLVTLEQGGFREVSVSGAQFMHTIHVPKFLDEIDAIINFCKVKTHMQARYTGALKNMFGIVTMQNRMEAHKHSKYLDFATTLVDIFSYMPPALNFADAIVGMEGVGPSQGTPVSLNYLAASPDALALDTICCSTMGFDPSEIGTIVTARNRNLGATSLNSIHLTGGTIEQFKKKCKRPSNALMKILDIASPLNESLMTVRPVIDTKKCKKCATCHDVCPAAAITKSPSYLIDNSKCVLCYCCHELCPHDAVDLHKPLAVRIIERLGI